MIQPFVDLAPLPEGEVDIGVTWIDSSRLLGRKPEADEVFQSLFFKATAKNMVFFNFVVDEAKLEFQYIDDIEFERRDNFRENW